MKLLDWLKAIPKKSLYLGIVMIILVVALIILTAMSASRVIMLENSNANNAQPVYKNDTPPRETEKEEEPVDLSGIQGLSYVSRGDGTCSVTGIGSCVLTELELPAKSPDGDTVTKISDGAFADCRTLVSVSIPETVRTIGTGAFRGCKGLVAINVDENNAVYCSVGGVLFSKDKSVLVCYPINRAGSSYLLSTGVKAVSAYAFEGAANLEKLLYTGSIASFQKIDFLMGNDNIDKMSITCNYVSAK